MSTRNFQETKQNQRTPSYSTAKMPSEPVPEQAHVPAPAPITEPAPVRLITLVSYTKKGREVMLRWSGAGDLQRSESATGTWVTVASASPVTIQASSASNQSLLVVRTGKPIAYYRVKRRL